MTIEDALLACNERLSALVDAGLCLGAAVEPGQLLHEASQAVCRLTGGGLGVAAIVADDGKTITAHAVAGLPEETGAPPAWPSIDTETACGYVVASGRVTALTKDDIVAADLGLPAGVPSIDEFVAAPLGTASTVRGIIGVANKLGSGFSAEDRTVVQAIGAQAGRALENIILVRELKTCMDELARVSDAKTRLLACASHDLRQPLQALRLLVDLLTAQAKDERLAKIVANICKALSGAEELTSALVEVSRLDSGAVAVAREIFPLSRVFDTLTSECGPFAERKRLNLRVEATDVVLFSDPVLLHRAIRNLVWNAIRYTETGHIIVRCRRRGESKAAIQVWDTGRGIPADRRRAIFDDFYRIDESHEGSRKEGLGLGLPIVVRNIKLLNGHVTVRSRVARGSVFSLVIPT